MKDCPTRILALDFGTLAGYSIIEAHTDRTELVRSGVWNLAGSGKTSSARTLALSKQAKEAGMQVSSYDLRFWRLYQLVVGIGEAFSIDLLVYEDILFHVSRGQDLAWGGLRAAAMMAVAELREKFERNIKIDVLHSARLKSAATGKGNADKQDMLEAIKRSRPDLEPKDDNEVDAILLGFYFAQQTNGVQVLFPFLKKKKKVVRKKLR